MDSRIAAESVGDQLDEIMDLAIRDGQRFVVDREGQPAVVIMSIQDFIRNIAPPPGWLTAAWAGARQRGVDQLSEAEIEAEIRAARAERAG